jgi:uncharacterized membrane protein
VIRIATTRVLCVLAVLWAIVLPAAAYAAGQPAGSGSWHAIALAVYGLGGAICHQRADRSFHLFGAQLPVCARCTGIYLGAAAISVWYVVSGFSRTVTLSRTSTVRLKADTTDVRVFLGLAALPALLTLVYEWTTGDVPANWIRAATGLVLGAATAAVVLDAVTGGGAPREISERESLRSSARQSEDGVTASGGGAPRE